MVDARCPPSVAIGRVLYGTAFLAPSPYQAYAHWGSFYTTDGGATFASDYWHLPNPDLKPQRKQTIETHVIHGLRPGWSLNASLFATRATNLIQESDPSQAYSGLYHGWPVAYIDFPVNDGRETNYGGSIGLDVLKSITARRRFEGRIALALVDGRVWNPGSPNGELRIGAVAPLQLRLGADLDWDGWTMAPRLAVVSTQRVLATRLEAGKPVRETVPGYATLDVNVRRSEVFRHVDLFLTLENAFDARYRHINTRAFTNPEELLGAPQNPRRITVGFDLRLR